MAMKSVVTGMHGHAGVRMGRRSTKLGGCEKRLLSADSASLTLFGFSCCRLLLLCCSAASLGHRWGCLLRRLVVVRNLRCHHGCSAANPRAAPTPATNAAAHDDAAAVSDADVAATAPSLLARDAETAAANSNAQQASTAGASGRQASGHGRGADTSRIAA
eukprot:364849-Chlamydomonas_euryale.AAC.6